MRPGLDRSGAPVVADMAAGAAVGMGTVAAEVVVEALAGSRVMR